MAKIYTKTGDDGTTGLIGGKRVSKDSTRVEAYGSVDELNAVLGVILSQPLPERVERVLQLVQDALFTIGAELALPEDADRSAWGIPDIRDRDILALEEEIDVCQASLAPLRQFILPGGASAAALMHVARAIARRAERRCVALSRVEKVDPQLIQYLNRLSDLCFVLARYLNQKKSLAESHPTFGKKPAG